MREIAATDAKARLPRLLTDVERGETVIITRHGRPIARLVSEHDLRQDAIDQAIEGIRALKSRKNRITVAELLSTRDEGRRY